MPRCLDAPYLKVGDVVCRRSTQASRSRGWELRGAVSIEAAGMLTPWFLGRRQEAFAVPDWRPAPASPQKFFPGEFCGKTC